MIPVLDPKEYDVDNTIPDDILSILIVSIPKYEQARIQTLLEECVKSYIDGQKNALDMLNLPANLEEIKASAEEFLKEYKQQIEQGYTVIQGENVYWLRDRTLLERRKIFDIISKSIKTGSSPDVTKRNLMSYFDMQKSQAETIARTENSYVRARGTEQRLKEQGVEKVKWLLGKNPCEICIPFGGHIYSWDQLPYQIPVHPRCTCWLAPVME